MSADQPTRPLPVLPHVGDFGLVATFGDWRDRFVPGLIRWGTNAPVNHTFVYVGDGMIVEAAPTGARMAPADSYGDRVTWSTGRLPLDDQAREEIARAALAIAQHRIPYGWLDIVAITLAQDRVGGWIEPTDPLEKQPWWVRRVQSMGTLICSQLVDVCYEAAGFHLFTDGRLPGLVSPGDLWRRIGRPVVVAG